MSDQITELDLKIRRQQTLLAMYEETLTLEDEPRRILRLQEDIEQVKALILGYETQRARLRQDAMPAPQPTQQESVLLTNYAYGLEGHFVGREDEMLLLDDWYYRDTAHPLLAMIGLGGMGKSALTWRWMQQLREAGQAPPIVVWWSFYETDGTLDKMLITILRHLGANFQENWNLRRLYDTFAMVAQQVPMLIMLDGAERLLRAYGSMGAAYQGDQDDPQMRERARECIDPVADGMLRWLAATPGRVRTLLTSRLLPRGVQGRVGDLLVGVRRHDLTGLSLAAAVELFAQAQIKATRAEVEAVCEPLGYHPLTLRLLVSYLKNDPRGRGDIRNAISYDADAGLLGRREHVLARVYDSLNEREQLLLGQMAALRSAVAWDLLVTAFGGTGSVGRELRTLVQRGLVQDSSNANGERLYDLHPIVRRYAYGRLADRMATHEQLVTAFEAVPEPTQITKLADLLPTVELYHHLANAGRYAEAFTLFRDRLHRPLYYQLGAYQTCIDLLRALFVDGEDTLPRLQDASDQAWTLNALANSYALAGRPKSAIPLFELSNQIDEKRGGKLNLAIGLGNVSLQEREIGRIQSATGNLRRRITLCREIENRFKEAVGHQELGRTLAISGAWAEADAELQLSLEFWEETNDYQGLTIDWAYRAEAALLRGGGQSTARAAARKALHFAEEWERVRHRNSRDFVRCHWLLGWSALAAAQEGAADRDGLLAESERELDEAIRRCRAINLVQFEPRILLAQARLAIVRAQREAVVALLDEAARIAERSGYVLDLADIYNERAALALATNDRAAARTHAQTARDHAWCDGPPYAYQSALDRADAMLAELGG